MGYTRREPLPKPTPTWQEKKLYDCLIKRGVRAELQKWDGYKHIDIAIVVARVNIEVDGIQHNQDVKQALADLKRTFHSFRKNYVTLRIPNCLTRNEKTIEETADYIVEFLNASVDQLYDDNWD
jgi:very-short-patch-repair endonuclease